MARVAGVDDFVVVLHVAVKNGDDAAMVRQLHEVCAVVATVHDPNLASVSTKFRLGLLRLAMHPSCARGTLATRLCFNREGCDTASGSAHGPVLDLRMHARIAVSQCHRIYSRLVTCFLGLLAKVDAALMYLRCIHHG